MPTGKKYPKKCYLSKEEANLLQKIARGLGISESEALRVTLVAYAKDLSLVKNAVHKGQ